ncbi:MAG: signal recognition particle protein [Rickettsiales bacterium]|nr:signal recognition particle protein [Rickettsiales bacterium]
MFDTLTRKLETTFRKLTGRTTLSAAALDDALSEIKTALLEADVSLGAAKQIVAAAREKSIGQKIIENTRPGEMAAKIVYDELVAALGSPGPSPSPNIIMLVGLQGTGKTTTAGKLAKYYKDAGREVLLVSTDIYRPGAREQLAVLARQAGVESLPIIEGESVKEILARLKSYLVSRISYLVIIDTAGRLQIDDAMMKELLDIKAASHPDEILLTADAAQGQTAVAVAKEFNERVGITGLVLTRADGDARGGAAISMRIETGAPIKWLGAGEKIDALEQFHPDRIASRILGMGDVVSLVEKAQSVVSEDEAKSVVKKMMSGDFDLNTMMWQIEKMKKMGGMAGLLKLIPGVGGMIKQIQEKANDAAVDRQLAILRSMTPAERGRPDIIFASRKERIAKGAGVPLREVENLLKKFAQTKTQMKALGGMPGLPNF